MKMLLVILRKEFQQIRRNPAILRIIFMMPAVQLLVLPLAADYEVKNVNLCVVDQDHSAYSQLLLTKLAASEYFIIKDVAGSYDEALGSIEKMKPILFLPSRPILKRI